MPACTSKDGGGGAVVMPEPSFDVAARNVARWRDGAYLGRWSHWNKGHVVLRVPRAAVPPPGFDLMPDGTMGCEVSPFDLDSWYDLNWFFTWRDKRFHAFRLTNGVVSGTLVDADQPFATANGLEIRDRAWYVGSFPLAQVVDLHEERDDRLAALRGGHSAPD